MTIAVRDRLKLTFAMPPGGSSEARKPLSLNAERWALFVGLWPPMIWLLGDSLERRE